MVTPAAAVVPEEPKAGKAKACPDWGAEPKAELTPRGVDPMGALPVALLPKGADPKGAPPTEVLPNGANPKGPLPVQPPTQK